MKYGKKLSTILDICKFSKFFTIQRPEKWLFFWSVLSMDIIEYTLFIFFIFFFAAELIQITFLVDGTLLCVRNLKHVERSVVFDELSAI